MQLPRVLIIDDEPDVGDTIAEVARALGFDASYTNDPSVFERLVADWKPDIVLTDLQMPHLDGVAVLRTLAVMGCPAKVGIISGLEAKVIRAAEDVARERGLTISGRLAKPFTVGSLMGLLKELAPGNAATLAEVEAAVRNGEIGLHMQPKCTLASGEIIGAEALARWRTERPAPMPAATLVRIIEQLGLSQLLLEQMLRNGLVQLCTLHEMGFALCLAVNMSGHDIKNLYLPDRLEGLCQQFSVAPSFVTLELTETTSVDLSADVLDVLARLRVKGFRLSVDDFGTGYSSLLRLRRLPFSELKIDRSFISTVTTDLENNAIVRAIAGMAQSLELACVAEGVESAATAKQVMAWGCKFAQGEWFGMPMPAEDFRSLVERAGYRRANAACV